jgi:hypothetical protein
MTDNTGYTEIPRYWCESSHHENDKDRQLIDLSLGGISVPTVPTGHIPKAWKSTTMTAEGNYKWRHTHCLSGVNRRITDRDLGDLKARIYKVWDENTYDQRGYREDHTRYTIEHLPEKVGETTKRALDLLRSHGLEVHLKQLADDRTVRLLYNADTLEAPGAQSADGVWKGVPNWASEMVLVSPWFHLGHRLTM